MKTKNKYSETEDLDDFTHVAMLATALIALLSFGGWALIVYLRG